MAIVVGVDFGTLSVRVTLLDSGRSGLSTTTAEYPLAIDTAGSSVICIDQNLDSLDDYHLWCDIALSRKRAGCREGDVVNVVGTSACIIAMQKQATLVSYSAVQK